MTGLRYDRETRAEARGDGKVLKLGLGALGTGRMWVSADTSEYEDVPYAPETKDDFGETGFATGGTEAASS
jgi:hypothetical protein